MRDEVAGVTDVSVRSGSAITSATPRASAPMAAGPAGADVSDVFLISNSAETPAPADEPLGRKECWGLARGGMRDGTMR